MIYVLYVPVPTITIYFKRFITFYCFSMVLFTILRSV